MAELTIETLIKIIIGVIVFVAVVLGVYFAFKNNIFDFFKNMGGNESNQAGRFILSLIK